MTGPKFESDAPPPVTGARPIFVTGPSQFPDAIHRPAHYLAHPSGVECITITEGFTFNLGNAIKYIWRAGLKSKDPREDLAKAQWYLARELQRLGPK